MKSFLGVIDYFEETEGIREGDKAIYVFYKNKMICHELFREVKDIKGLLERIYFELLDLEPSLKIMGKLNFIYFKWLEEKSELNSELKERFMEKELVDLSLVTQLHEAYNREKEDQWISLIYKNEAICYQSLKNVTNIREFLKEIHLELLSRDSNLKVEDQFNFFYFNWLEKESRRKEELYGKRVS